MNYIDDYENQELEEYKNSCADFTLGVIEALKDYDRNKLLHCVEELANLNNIQFNADVEALLLI